MDFKKLFKTTIVFPRSPAMCIYAISSSLAVGMSYLSLVSNLKYAVYMTISNIFKTFPPLTILVSLISSLLCTSCT